MRIDLIEILGEGFPGWLFESGIVVKFGQEYYCCWDSYPTNL